MKTLHLPLIMFTVIIFLGFGLQPVHADDANGISIQNIKVQPSTVKVGDSFTVTATLVNNSTVLIVLDGGTCVPIIEHVPFFTVMFDNHAKIKAENMTCAGVGLSKILNSGKTIIGTSPDSTLAYIATKSGTANVTVTFSYHVTNQTDPTQPNIEQTISKSLLFTIYDNNTGTKIITETVSSPLKQFKSGTASLDVKCKQDLLLIIKSENNLPACTRPLTALHLLERGWGQITSPFDTTEDLLNSKISGGTISGYHYDLHSKIILIKIQTTSDGNLTVTIPRKLINAQVGSTDTQFFVLGDGKEISSDEIHTTIQDRTLSIQFQKGTEEIEIIGTNGT